MAPMAGLLVAGAPALHAALTVKEGEGFQVEWNSIPLIQAEVLEAVPGARLDAGEGSDSREADGAKIRNTWRVKKPHEQVTWRRESVEGKDSVEMTISYRIPSYYFTGAKSGLDSFYRLLLPLNNFEGMEYTAMVKEGVGTGIVKGKIVNGKFSPALGKMTNFLALSDGGERNICFDFGPHGLTSFNTWVAPNSLPQAWWVGDENGLLRASIGRYKKDMYPHNGVYFGKIVIREGKFEEFYKRHAVTRYYYFMEMPAMRQFSFGTGDGGASQKSDIAELKWSAKDERLRQWIGDQEYSSASGAGWVSTKGISLEGDSSVDPLNGRAYGKKAASLRVDVPQPGVYLFTMRATGGKVGAGPFSLKSKGETIFEDQNVASQELKTMTFARYITGDHTLLDFEGNWTVNTLSVQKLIYQDEDFAFKRGLWMADDLPAPSGMYLFPRRPVPAAAAIETIALTKGSGDKHGREQRGESVIPSPDAPELLWRWESDINSLGPSRGNLYEFETDEQIARRLDELEALGYKVILVNPELIRHAFPEEHARMRATMARIVRHAHKRGMKVFDHFDVTIVPNMGAAYQQFVENLGWAQRDVRNNLPTRGWCLNNPDFQQHFTKMMVDYVKEANIDGIMLDELCWHGQNFCGCEHCRVKFKKDTGLELPTSIASDDLLNRESVLWKQWLRWRPKAQGDYAVSLLKAIQEVRPDFVWMKYGAPTVYVSNYPEKSGLLLTEATRFSSYMGIEILSNNLHATYRSNLAVGSIYNSQIDAKRIPSYGLVYHRHSPVIAYAGWAQNNMNRLRTWSTQGNKAIEEDAHRYVGWKENMDLRTARQVADVGVWFSETSRDYGNHRVLAMEELVGMCEQLDDLHHTYRVLWEGDASLEELRKYRLIVLPNVTALSDKELGLLKAYMEQGGKVLATGASAAEDELGVYRKEWPIGEWLGLSLDFSGVEKATLSKDGRSVALKTSAFVAKAKSAVAVSNMAAEYQLGHEGGEAPGLVSKAFGKGSLTWCAASLGAENFEHDARGLRTIQARSNSEGLQALGQIMAGLLGDEAALAARAPKEVRLRLFETESLDAKGVKQLQSHLHLYNGAGSNFEPNETTPKEIPAVPFPPVEKEMIFEIALPASDSGQPLSAPVAVYNTPDSTDPVEVAIEPLDKPDRFLIKLPANTLRAYGIIRITREVQATQEVAQDVATK